ncbi:uncharacterized protein [Miscanthus floridulus]|uniref:uncharacterized protein n=1 Tax=Miscanthus floridulus TaxID=154761 RepID=UPI00345908DD
MDGGNGHNILYAKTLDAMGIDRAHVWSTRAPFHGIMPRKQAMLLEQIDLPITFGGASNYRTETLAFEVVGFHRTYHAILGRPCYVKFIAIPNYTYLKLKILGPSRIITVGTTFQHAYECEVECCDHAASIVASREHTDIRKEVTEEAPDPKRSIGSFKPAEGSKEVLIDLGSAEEKNGILREVTKHTMKIRLGSKLVKQCLCRFNEGKRGTIDEEIAKLLVPDSSRKCTT